MSQIDLNCDLGESFGRYALGFDEQVMPHITSANIACGFHAGDPRVMHRTVGLAVKYRVSIGAHPGLPDLVGFGRRRMECTPEEIRQDVLYQIGALQAFARDHGTRLSHVKPHGALYHMVLESEGTARAVAEAVAAFDPGLVMVTLAGPKGDSMADIAQHLGLTVAREAFPDRGYTPEGILVPRHSGQALIQEPQTVAARALSMARDGQVQAVNGQMVQVEADTLCLHGDSHVAVELASTIRSLLEENAVPLRPVRSL
ncbi:MAG: 5-oxoprolinase subunit PxpA [Desulfovermiculus sp.]|nr:5-oxoprolinase subunit PxpA [Desulfovermiculus sp.]